jgi:alpha-tubulin suppressor-like RCC1 family protein
MGSILLNCALRNDNTHWFWGRFSPDAVNHTVNVTSPISISLAFTIAQLAGRFRHIALGTDNSIWTWGANADRLVANNTTATYSVPYNYMAANSTIRQVASGFDTFHYLKTDGTVWSWGRGSEGQLGDGVSYPSMTGVTTPVQASTGVSFVKIAANIFAVMALTAKGEIYTWGYGTGNATPTKVSTTVSFKDIAGMASAFFLLDKDHYLYAVGDTAYGVAGTYPPERVPGNIKVTRLPYASGNEYTGDPYASAFNFAL